MYGFREGNTALESYPHYRESENLFTICNICRITVPKICVSLGECVNCTDTDLFCVDQCLGGEMRKYCTHFVRLYTEGAHLIEQGQAFDLFPTLGMPGEKKDAARNTDTGPSHDAQTGGPGSKARS
jgi:hypothetical protein